MSKKSPDLRSEDLGPGLSLCGVICEVGMAAPALWTPRCLTRIKKRKLQKQCLTLRFTFLNSEVSLVFAQWSAKDRNTEDFRCISGIAWFSGGNFREGGCSVSSKLPNSDTLEILSLKVLFKCQVRDEDRFLTYKPQARRHLYQQTAW